MEEADSLSISEPNSAKVGKSSALVFYGIAKGNKIPHCKVPALIDWAQFKVPHLIFRHWQVLMY